LRRQLFNITALLFGNSAADCSPKSNSFVPASRSFKLHWDDWSSPDAGGYGLVQLAFMTAPRLFGWHWHIKITLIMQVAPVMTFMDFQ